jgi:hypothetical protein
MKGFENILGGLRSWGLDESCDYPKLPDPPEDGQSLTWMWASSPIGSSHRNHPFDIVSGIP